MLNWAYKNNYTKKFSLLIIKKIKITKIGDISELKNLFKHLSPNEDLNVSFRFCWTLEEQTNLMDQKSSTALIDRQTDIQPWR